MTTKSDKVDLMKSKGAETDTITSVELAELQKAASQLADLQKAKEEADAKVADLEKSNNEITAQLEAVELEKAAKAKADMVELVKGFTFISEEDQDTTVDSLLKNKDAVILVTLQKAQEAINEFAITEHGSDASNEDLEKSAAQKAQDDFDAAANEIMKERNNKGAK